MKKLLLLGTSNGTLQIIEYAKRHNIYTIVTDNLTKNDSVGKKDLMIFG